MTERPGDEGGKRSCQMCHELSEEEYCGWCHAYLRRHHERGRQARVFGGVTPIEPVSVEEMTFEVAERDDP